MISLIRHCEVSTIQISSKFMKIASSMYCTTRSTDVKEFRVLRIRPREATDTQRKPVLRFPLKTTPKAEKMPTDQNWPAVWPTARTFHPNVVPLPVRQGYKHNRRPHPDKYSTAELMKIPNFLHLTPPAVKAHCEALKKFCTKWPEVLTEKECQKHFPVEIITSDYCYSSPTIREPLARIVSLRVKVSSLDLNARARDKLFRLVGDRYNPKTDTLTIVADRCPTRKQNLEYVHYLLTALFHVSWRVEPWEAEKSEVDMTHYDWNTSKSRQRLEITQCWPEPPNLSYKDIPHAKEYKQAVSCLINHGENSSSLNTYKEAVIDVLNLKRVENME